MEEECAAMDVSELEQWRSVCEIRYPARARLFDIRGLIIQKTVTKTLTKWRKSQNRVDIFSKDETVRYFASFKNAGSVMEQPASVTVFRDGTVKFLRRVMEDLRIGELSRIGVRFYYLVRVPNFEKLVDVMMRGLYRLSDDDWQQVGGVPIDVGFPLTLKFGRRKANFMMGPMESSQLKGHFETDAVREKLPDASVFVDFDYYETNPSVGKKAPYRFVREFIDEASDTSRSYSEGLLAFALSRGEAE